MTQSLQLRATSLGASALLMGGALMAALSLKHVLPSLPDFSPPPIVDSIVVPLPPVEPEPIRDITPPRPLDEPIMQGVTIADHTEPTPTTTIGVFSPPSVVTVTNPRWLERPRDLERYYPRRAMRLGVEAAVTLDCRVSVDGFLDCAVISENPPNWGFAEAAQRIASEHRMTPAMRNGVAVEARYVMRVPFNLE